MSELPEDSVLHKAINAVPKGAYAICGIMIAFSISANIANIDLSSAVNSYMEAMVHKAVLRIEAENSCEEPIENAMVDIESRLAILEDVVNEAE